MKNLLLFVLLFISGCSGTGLEKRTTLVPNAVSVSYMQERFRGDSCAWRGMGVSATWEFK
jgi:hypothetical protein